MNDAECVAFLQWALPQLGMRWEGFRKVRRQVCKRIGRRIAQLQLADADAYRRFLSATPSEWRLLDRACRVTISRFYRDKEVFRALTERVLPAVATAAQAAGDTTLRCWSIGCASGEEAYTLAILWHELVGPRFPSLSLRILATDIDPRLLERAREARYAAGTLRDLPAHLRAMAFTPSAGQFFLRSRYRSCVELQRQDIRDGMPEEDFHLVLCRNLVFTYFDEKRQRQVLDALRHLLLPEGWLVLGIHEQLPPGIPGFVTVSDKLKLYTKAIGHSASG